MVTTPPALIKGHGWNRPLVRITERWKKMNVLDDLIRIKTNKQDDDLLKMLDELPVYEKLSVDEKLGDLKHSEITRKKCPLLAGFVDGKVYETVLADLAANVYLQIEGNIPLILQSAAELTAKKQKQLEILRTGIARVEYRDLLQYDHLTMKPFLTAVFLKKHNGVNIVAIIVRRQGGYVMYHGTYVTDEKGKDTQDAFTPIMVKGKNGVLTMASYSMLGNNGYPFAQYVTGNIRYNVMIGPDSEMYLMNDAVINVFEIPMEDKNTLNIAKKEPMSFAKEVTAIIEKVVKA